jgi:predicted nucleotidyltransferase
MAVKNTTMRSDLLPELLGSRLRAKVLGWLFTHTDESFYVRQLTALLDLDSANLSRELARLENMGLLASSTSGKQKYYQANQKCPIFNELHSLMVKTTGVADILRSALNPASHQIKAAFIFGSIASRMENRASDIDLMIIGDISFGDVVELFSPAEKTLHREINPVVYPVEEFHQKVKSDAHFVKTVLEGEKIFLIGDENELNRLCQ